jgi:hypothetical protein
VAEHGVPVGRELARVCEPRPEQRVVAAERRRVPRRHRRLETDQFVVAPAGDRDTLDRLVEEAARERPPLRAEPVRE